MNYNITLPSFLGIGAQRSGTTWLHELLTSHPDIYMPIIRKEVHFFDYYHERGLEWYGKFFPTADEAGQFLAVGEITPDYLYDVQAAERIAAALPNVKLVIILRNPADRAYSHYTKMAADDNYSKTFADALAHVPELMERGCYSRWLKAYFSRFGREQILILIYEHAVADVAATKAALSRFLNVPVDRFPPKAGTRKINNSFVPRARAVYALSKELSRKLHRWDSDWVVNLANRAGIKRIFSSSAAIPPMSEQTRCYLKEIYAAEVRELEALLSVDLARWK